MSDYARPELLAETDWLADHLHDANLVVVDCEEWPMYRKAHIPGAVASPSYHDRLKDPDNPTAVLSPERFKALMEEMGVGDDDLIVLYDADRSLYAARLWWALNYYGHHDVKVLNGGWNKWALEGRPVDVRPTARTGKTFTPKLEPQWVVSGDEVMADLGKPDFVALDVRSDGEYDGSNLRSNRFGGHMPGAVHLEWLNNVVEDDTHVFKPADDLCDMYRRAGVTEDKRLIAPY